MIKPQVAVYNSMARCRAGALFPELANRVSQHTFTKIDVDGYNEAVSGVIDENDVRCSFPGFDFLGNMEDMALSNTLYRGLSTTGDITCGTNLGSEPWKTHLHARIAEIS